jgi:methyl coenzyme M reductase gamma subunit
MPHPLETQSSLTLEDIAPLLLLSASPPTGVSRKTMKNDDMVPSMMDILCGRDKVSYSHVGNRRFRVIVEMNYQRYQKCTTREAKTRITDEIIEGIRECGGRFLRKNEDTGMYEDVGDEYAHEKVSHALRSAKPKSTKPRKKRKSVKKPPTPQEDKTFEFIYREQQKIFQEMLAGKGVIDKVQTQAWQPQDEEDVYAVGV